MKVALFREGQAVEIVTMMVNNQPTTLLPVDHSSQLKAVLLNYDDYAFVKILVDPLSIDYL